MSMNETMFSDEKDTTLVEVKLHLHIVKTKFQIKNKLIHQSSCSVVTSELEVELENINIHMHTVGFFLKIRLKSLKVACTGKYLHALSKIYMHLCM